MRRGAACRLGQSQREQRAGRTQVWRLLAGAREKRTENMYSMVVTLEVSRLSG